MKNKVKVILVIIFDVIISYFLLRGIYFNFMNEKASDCDINYDYQYAFHSNRIDRDINKSFYMVLDFENMKMTTFFVKFKNFHNDVAYVNEVKTYDITGSYEKGWSNGDTEFNWDEGHNEINDSNGLHWYPWYYNLTADYLKYLK